MTAGAGSLPAAQYLSGARPGRSRYTPVSRKWLGRTTGTTQRRREYPARRSGPVVTPRRGAAGGSVGCGNGRSRTAAPYCGPTDHRPEIAGTAGPLPASLVRDSASAAPACPRAKAAGRWNTNRGQACGPACPPLEVGSAACANRERRASAVGMTENPRADATAPAQKDRMTQLGQAASSVLSAPYSLRVSRWGV